jgi:hypothetical protein
MTTDVRHTLALIVLTDASIVKLVCFSPSTAHSRQPLLFRRGERGIHFGEVARHRHPICIFPLDEAKGAASFVSITERALPGGAIATADSTRQGDRAPQRPDLDALNVQWHSRQFLSDDLGDPHNGWHIGPAAECSHPHAEV